MSLPALHVAISNATAIVADGTIGNAAARFILFPLPGTDLEALAAAVENDLVQFDGTASLDHDSGRSTVIVTLPLRIMVPTEQPFSAAYLMTDQWHLQTAEPELYTDYFPEPDQLPGNDGVDEGLLDFCWAPADPDILQHPSWAIDMMRVPEAWARSAELGRPGMGAGIVIAQPDTGVTDHPEMAGVERHQAIDLISGGLTALDPLDYLGNTSHGTGTGSVMVSRGTGTITGSAPAAIHMPVRAIQHVVRVSQLMVAKAITHAVDNGARVITMSLGGLPSLFLWHALRRAVARDVIVMAAAGNCVGTVVWPARYDDCIAIAGVNIKEERWRGSSRGSAVAVAAPAENVLKALTTSNAGTSVHTVAQGQGTSFAVALTAGVAALWLAHHSVDVVTAAARAQGISVQALFKRLLKATARQPAVNWDEATMGAGIVDACALLQAELTLNAGQEEPPLEAPHTASLHNLLAEAGADAELGDSTLDLYGVELAKLALDARRARTGSRSGEEAGAPLPVSRRLNEAVPASLLNQLRKVQS